MNLRQSYLKMIKAFPGGWDALVGALATTRNSLENRIYERKGQLLHVETAMMMQSMSGTTYFAEAVAALSGGVFMKLALDGECDDELLHAKFQELYTELGMLSAEYTAAIADHKIDKKEKATLIAIKDQINKTLQELLAIIFHVYCEADKAGVAE